MLENIPVITKEAAESIGKHGIEPPTPGELEQVLSEVQQHNPQLIKAVLDAGVDNTLEFFLTPLKESSIEAYNTLHHYLIWGTLVILDLVDRELFAAKLASQVDGSAEKLEEGD